MEERHWEAFAGGGSRPPAAVSGLGVARSRLSISRSRYQRAFFRSSIALAFRSARQIYLTAFPRLKPMCSVIVMHSTPDGWAV